MDSNLLTFFGGIVVLLMFYGSFSRVRLFAFVGSVLMLVLGIFILSDGITLKTAEQTLTVGNSTIVGNNTTVFSNATMTSVYSTPTKVSVFDWSFLYGFTLLLAGLGGAYVFSMEN
jgi:hypothetical protein